MKKNEGGCGSLIALCIIVWIIAKVLDTLYFFRYVILGVFILIPVTAVILIIVNMLPSRDDIDTDTQPYTDTEESNTEKAYSEHAVPNIDNMEGHQFEYFCSGILRKIGYENVHVTKGSGDQGVDIIAERDGIKYAIQCKRQNTHVGNKAVQEAYAGAKFYGCHIGIVMSNNYFTQSAKELAGKTGVVLWDRNFLTQFL